MNEEKPLKIWGQPDPVEDKPDADGAKLEGKEAGAADGVALAPDSEREIVLTDLQDQSESEKKGFFGKKKGKKQKGKLAELKGMDSRERLDYLRDSSVATKDSLVRTKEAAIQSGPGRKARGLWESLGRFLKTYRGKRTLSVLIMLFIALVAVNIWLKGADLRKGVKLCDQGNYVDAQVHLKNAVEKNNMDPKAYNMLGMAYLGSGEYEDARKQFLLAQNLDPDSQDAWRGLGIIYYYTGDYKDAVSALNNALKNCGVNVNNTEYDIMWYRAAAETAMKDYDAAEYTYGALMELEGDTAPVRYYRGSVYCLMNDKEKAMADFDAAVGMKGNSYDLYFDIYNSLMDRGWSKEAEAYMKQCNQPGMVDTSKLTEEETGLYQGMMFYLEGSYKEAAKQLSAAVLEDNFQALTYKALAYEGMKNYKKALSTYKSILKRYPSSAQSYNGIALYLLRRGKEKSALSYLEKGVNSCPGAERRVLYYNMVTAKEQAGDYKGAQDMLRAYGVIYGQSKIRHENYFAKERDRS